jgi:hypothetical protein
MARERRGTLCRFLRFRVVDLRVDPSQEIDLRGREVSRGDGNLVSIECECSFNINHRC